MKLTAKERAIVLRAAELIACGEEKFITKELFSDAGKASVYEKYLNLYDVLCVEVSFTAYGDMGQKERVLSLLFFAEVTK